MAKRKKRAGEEVSKEISKRRKKKASSFRRGLKIIDKMARKIKKEKKVKKCKKGSEKAVRATDTARNDTHGAYNLRLLSVPREAYPQGAGNGQHSYTVKKHYFVPEPSLPSACTPRHLDARVRLAGRQAVASSKLGRRPRSVWAGAFLMPPMMMMRRSKRRSH